MAREILFVPHNHFDPVWRRCFDRPAHAHGTTVQSYADVEELCIHAFLKLAPLGYTFSDGQTAIWRKYLQRNPDNLAALHEHARAGLLDVALAGETVPDTNLSTAEGLVRNFLVAMPVYRRLVPADHPGLKLGWLEDAFGNSPNYPQILIGVGAEAACNTSYRFCPTDVWVGLDGTKIRCYDNHPAVRIGSFEKHPPCPACRGARCSKCNRTGLQLLPGFDRETLLAAFEKAAEFSGDWVSVFLLTEEILPDPAIFDLISDFNLKHAGQATVRIANPSDLYRRYLPVMDAAMEKNDGTATPELNPAMPGCMVTRIKCKQRTRSVAYDLISAEAVLANRSWKRRKPAALPAAFTDAWQKLTFNQFHDAITGTHIDAAYDELMEMLDKAHAVAAPLLPAPKQAARPVFVKLKSPLGVKRLGNLSLSFDRQGITGIDCDGAALFGIAKGFTRVKRPLRIAELVLEADFGDAWGQRIAPFPALDRDSSQVPLGDFNRSVEVSPRSIRWRGSYTGGDPKVKHLRWTITASVSPDGRRIDFVTDVDWDTASRRLRAIVPVQSSEPTATYEVPFGFIERSFDADKIDFGQWRSHTMEWPTLHWVQKKIDDRSGVAILNKGLPCNRWMPGRFDLSLVRSPEWQFCAVEPGNYEFWDIDGQRDAGKHRFEYSIWPYTDGVSKGDLIRAGYDYNLPRPIDPPFSVLGDVVVTAWKPAEAGNGWILRLQNASGGGTTVGLSFTGTMRITPVNLIESPQQATITATTYETHLHGHGIHTVLLQFPE